MTTSVSLPLYVSPSAVRSNASLGHASLTNELPKQWENTLVYGPYRDKYLVLHVAQALQLQAELRVLAALMTASSWDDVVAATDLQTVSHVLAGTCVIANAYEHSELVAWHTRTCPLRVCQEGPVACDGEGCPEHRNCDLNAHAAFDEAPPAFESFQALVRTALPDLVGELLADSSAVVYVQQGRYIDVETPTVPPAIADLAHAQVPGDGGPAQVWPESAIPHVRKLARQEGYLLSHEPDLITRIAALVGYLQAMQARPAR